VSTRRTDVVRAGYDAIRERYLEWSAQIDDDPRHRFVQELS
jgi:hypothetical protein